MRLTVVHLEYWRARKVAPSWAALMIGAARGAGATAVRQRAGAGPSVHECIAAHAGELHRQRHAHEASNLLGLLRLQVRNGRPLRDALRAASHGTSTHPYSSRRAAYAHKWLQKCMHRKSAA